MVPPTDLPDVPPHVNCETGWHFVDGQNLCYYVDAYERGWDAAESNCISLGGHLVSINSPDMQLVVFGLTAFDPTASGK